MAMPKTPMDKYTGVEFGHYNVGVPWEVLSVDAKSKTTGMKEPPDHHFRTSIFAFYATHHF
jgi:hypothetical protein